MPPYDDRLFVPPAPVLTARLRNLENGTIIADVPLVLALLLDGPQQTWSEHRGDRIPSR
jgi:hypothetical protein